MTDLNTAGVKVIEGNIPVPVATMSATYFLVK